METIVLSVSAFLIALLTFFSGFGLGTLLTPVFMIFFPLEVAIALTGIVHFFNNIFKLLLIGKYADRATLVRFGLPAIIAAVIGSWLLFAIPNHRPLFSYVIDGREFEVPILKFTIAALLLLFALVELIPYFRKLQFSKDKLAIGGFLSGFFGGLSGVQGALRSAFLIRAGLSKKGFIATAVVVSTLVDVTRLSVYAANFSKVSLDIDYFLVTSVTLSGIAGSYLGNRILEKVTLRFLQIVVAVMLSYLPSCSAVV